MILDSWMKGNVKSDVNEREREIKNFRIVKFFQNEHFWPNCLKTVVKHPTHQTKWRKWTIINRSITFRNQAISLILIILLYNSLLFWANLERKCLISRCDRSIRLNDHISKSSIFSHFSDFPLKILTVFSQFGQKSLISNQTSPKQ